jgi:2-oxoglutarate dehydrogenase E1 component
MAIRASLASRLNPEVFDENYERWKTDPLSVEADWAMFFEGYELGQAPATAGSNGHAATTAAPAASNGHGPAPATGKGARFLAASEQWQAKVDNLVYMYRALGHTIAQLDPLGGERHRQPLLELKALGFTEADLERQASSPFFLGGTEMSLGEMIEELRTIYSGPIGAEFMHIHQTPVRNWLRDHIDPWPELSNYKPRRKARILRRLLEAETFERFLHERFKGQKRFSLEGGESLMVALDTLYQRSERHDVHEIVMGMAHRGRLNVLTNFLHKPFSKLFAEFSENFIPDSVYGNGDVKYHLGYRTVRRAKAGSWEVMITLAANPSHLEAVDPVVEGMARARQRILSDTDKRRKVLPVLVHGDAAFAGQGIVSEVFNFSQLPGYRTGGTVHIIVNNQIGFTTLPADARSSEYATDVAKMIDAPIFHVNGESPEAVAYVTALAFDFRQKFGRDVVVDIYCFRRHGHNEGDEPMFTQPNLYEKIQKHPSAAKVYQDALLAGGHITPTEVEEINASIKNKLEDAFAEAKKAEEKRLETQKSLPLSAFLDSTAVFQPPYTHQPVDTRVTRERLAQIVDGLTKMPREVEPLDKIKRLVLDGRRKMYEAGGPYDWGFGEALAIGSLLVEGTAVRLSGQDSRRGTFSHRHSAIYDVKTRERYFPLKNLAKDQGTFCVYNSPLSEASVLGFDYGYSIEYPQMLCMWEAQFGDFVNGAQVIIDQFIASAESKWQQPSGLVLLLPHGYDGQGPEHSSARLERFLQLCAEDNMQVANLTTPAQLFHMLRRQMKRAFRKPLVLMTPKALLRHPDAVSREADFTEGQFHEVLKDPANPAPESVERIIFCTGKVYYDLAKERESRHAAGGATGAAIVRLEQIYPLHKEAVKEVVASYPKAQKIIWCQEEHSNMGAWSFVEPEFRALLGREITYIGRDRSASPAVGFLALHRVEQKDMLNRAFES